LFVFEICISYHLAVFALQRTKKPAFDYLSLTFFDHFDLIKVGCGQTIINWTCCSSPSMHFKSSDYAVLLMHSLKAGLVFDSDLSEKKTSGRSCRNLLLSSNLSSTTIEIHAF